MSIFIRDKVLIHVYGTSHVSGESIELIDEKIEEHDPDVVALELDLTRLEALVNEETEKGGPLFIRLIRRFQESIGSKTGVMPGEEMLYAYHKALSEERDVILIDQDIQITVNRLMEIPRKEKFRAVLSIFLGFLTGKGFDFSEIPDEKLIDRLLEELKDDFPSIYRVLVEERNMVMTESLRSVQEENPEEDIVAFVGAAHRKELEKMLAE